jgi:hypothetical protein
MLTFTLCGIGSTLVSLREALMSQWWYNLRTKQVEEGMLSPAVDRAGPFGSREEAERAPEIIAERSRRWAAEEAAEES